VSKQSLQSEMRCSSQTGRLLHCTHLIRFFILSIAEVASLPRRQMHHSKVLGGVGALLYLISVAGL